MRQFAFILAITFGLVGSSLFADYRVRLQCEGFEHDSLRLVRLIELDDGAYQLIELHENGKEKSMFIDPSLVKEGPLQLSPLYGYSRQLVKKNGKWVIQYGCGSTTDIKCDEGWSW